MREKADDPDVLFNLPRVVEAVSGIIRTDAPLDRFPEIVSVVQRSASAETRRHVLGPPNFASGVRDENGDRTFMNQLDLDAVAALSIELFGEESRYYQRAAGEDPEAF